MCDYVEPNPAPDDAMVGDARGASERRAEIRPESGAAPAITATLVRHLDRVAQAAVARSGRREIDSESILARVLCRIAPQLERWEGRRPELQKYLTTAIRHEIVSELRRLRRAPRELPQDSTGPGARDPMPGVSSHWSVPLDRGNAFLAAVSALGLGDLAERLVELHGCRGLSWDQTGIEVGITAEHARTKWHQIRERVLRGVVRPLGSRLTALDGAILDALVVQGLTVDAAAEELALDRAELYERMVFSVVPMLHDAFGSDGVAAMHRLARRAKPRGC